MVPHSPARLHLSAAAALPLSKREATVAALAACCLFLIYATAALRFPFHGVWHDDGIYIELGRSLLSGSYDLLQLPGEPLQAKYPPLHPLVMSLVWAFGGDTSWDPSVFALPGAAFGALGFLLWYRLLRSGAGIAAALAPGPAATVVVIAALSPVTVLLCSSAMAEPLIVLLLPAALLVLCKPSGATLSCRRTAVAGLLLGLAALTRQAALTAGIGVLLHLVSRRQWRQALVLAAVHLALLAPWWAWQQHTLAHAQHQEGTLCAYYTSYERVLPRDLDELAAILPARWHDLTTGTARQLLGAVFLPELWWSLTTPMRQTLVWSCHALTAAAFVLLLARSRRRPCAADWLLGASLATALLYRHPTWRLMVPCLVLVNLGFLALCRLVLDQLGLRLRPWLVLLLIAAPNVAITTCMQLQLVHQGPARMWRDVLDVSAHRELARYVRQHLAPGAVLACDYDPFYYWATGRKAVMLANLDPVSLLGDGWPADATLAARCLVEYERLGVTHLLDNPSVEVPVADMLREMESTGVAREVHRSATPGYRVLELRRAGKPR